MSKAQAMNAMRVIGAISSDLCREYPDNYTAQSASAQLASASVAIRNALRDLENNCIAIPR